MAMTLATLRSLTRQLIGDPQGSTYSPEMYQDAINFACKEYAKKTGVTYVETAVSMDSTTGLCTIPTAYMRINRVLVGGVLAFGVYILDNGGAKTAVPIGTNGSDTIPDDASRYLLFRNCILLPSNTATLAVKKETIQIKESSGDVVTSVQSDSIFSILVANPNFTISGTESCHALSSDNCLPSGQYADFTLIGVCNGISGEIKVRYVQPHT